MASNRLPAVVPGAPEPTGPAWLFSPPRALATRRAALAAFPGAGALRFPLAAGFAPAPELAPLAALVTFPEDEVLLVVEVPPRS